MSKMKKTNQNGPLQRAREVVEAAINGLLPSATKTPKRSTRRKRKAHARA